MQNDPNNSSGANNVVPFLLLFKKYIHLLRHLRANLSSESSGRYDAASNIRKKTVNRSSRKVEERS